MPPEVNPSEARLRELFAAALERPSAEERRRYLDKACGGDAGLRSRVEALLRAYERADHFLDQNVHGEDIEPEAGEAGTLIGPYRLIERLGVGGFGVVYRAEQSKPIRREVALKIIKLGMDTRAVIARFEAERQALALMDHPNIAKVLDAGATETGRPYFVMELVKGVRITDYCDQRCLSTPERLELFMQVCRAIQHAHQKGIIHRDLKPSNILVTAQDGVRVPKVIDFGIAKATGCQALTDKTVYTAVDQFLGTPAYTSPEQAQAGGVDIDTRSDIYNLGVLLYELLTGHTPFEPKQLIAAGMDEMRRIIREQEPARPSTRLSSLASDEQTTVAQCRRTEAPQLIHQLRGDLDWIVMKCLEKERNRRYETASGLADDAARHLADEPVRARPPGVVYRLGKHIRRNRLAWGAAATVGLALVLAVLVTAWQAILVLVLGVLVSTWLLVREQAAHRQAVTAQRQAQAQAKKSQQVAQFLEDMLRGVGPSVAMGRDTTILREILAKTAERIGKDLKDQPAVEAELRHTLGWVYCDLGDDHTAETFFRDALALRRKLYGNESREVADSLAGLGLALVRQGGLAEADATHREALAIRRRLFGNDNLDTAQSLNDLAIVVSAQGKPAEAEAMVREALSIKRKFLREPDRAIAWSLLVLATTLGSQGKLDEAETIQRQALAMQRKLYGNKYPAVALSLDQLGLVLARKGKFAEAEASLAEALETYRELQLPNHPHVRAMRSTLARVLACEGKFVESEPLYREELEQLHIEAEQGNAGSQNEFARHLATCILPALRDGTTAVSFAEKAVAATNRMNVGYLDTLAAAYAEVGQFPKAVATEKEAIALLSEGQEKEDFKSRLKLYESNTPYRNRCFQ